MGISSRPRAGEPVKFVSKGWGYEKWIVNCEKYCGKLLFIAKGKKCSWHYHRKKDEVFYVQSGFNKDYTMDGMIISNLHQWLCLNVVTSFMCPSV